MSNKAMWVWVVIAVMVLMQMITDHRVGNTRSDVDRLIAEVEELQTKMASSTVPLLQYEQFQFSLLSNFCISQGGRYIEHTTEDLKHESTCSSGAEVFKTAKNSFGNYEWVHQ